MLSGNTDINFRILISQLGRFFDMRATELTRTFTCYQLWWCLNVAENAKSKIRLKTRQVAIHDEGQTNMSLDYERTLISEIPSQNETQNASRRMF